MSGFRTVYVYIPKLILGFGPFLLAICRNIDNLPEVLCASFGRNRYVLRAGTLTTE